MKFNLGNIAGIGALAGIGFVAYKFLTGDWKLPGIPGIDPQTIAESGVPGVVGDIIYNITYPTELRESATQPGGTYYESAKTEIINILPPRITPTTEQIVPRAVSTAVSEDIIGGGLLKAIGLAPVTIGAGLGAITQQERYYAALPEDSRTLAIRQTVETREQWRREHPAEYLGASALSWIFPPAAIIGKAAEAYDIIRASKPITAPGTVATPGVDYIPSPPETFDPGKMVQDPGHIGIGGR